MGIEVTGSNDLAADDIAIPPTADAVNTPVKAEDGLLGEMCIIRRNGKVTGFDGLFSSPAAFQTLLTVFIRPDTVRVI